MTYLLAKYALLFFLTALFGFILGYWWVRRRFVDVSESYETLTTRASTDEFAWSRLWGHLNTFESRMGVLENKVDAIPKPPEVDFGDVYSRIDGVSSLVSRLPAPEPVKFDGVHERMDKIEKLISSLPKPEMPEPVNLGPINDGLQKVETLIGAIPVPEPVDLGGVHERIESVYQRVERLEAALGALPKPEPVNLGGVFERIDKLPERIDLAPMNDRMSRIEAAIKGIRIPEAANLDPVELRLREIEERLDQRAAAPPAPPPAPQSSGPRLLKTAAFGKPDDLKRISGVGPKLERLLHQIGVYYFWQVASWSKQDVTDVDDLLEVFKGRIERDNWVVQAENFKREPGSAREPASS